MVVRFTLILAILIFQMVHSTLTVEATSDNLVCHNKLIKFLLQIVVLESEKIGMILQSMQLLLVAMASFKERFITLSDGFELTGESLKLVVVLNVGAFGTSDVCIELS